LSAPIPVRATAVCTDALREQFAELGADLPAFVQKFCEWKSLGPAGEYSSYFFGKDVPFLRPTLAEPGGELRHVHLVPLLDKPALADWDKKHLRGSRKTSNRILAYVGGGRGSHLLLYILAEPTAHDVMKMQTEDDRTLMKQFAQVADVWLRTGEVIA
jgi:hypothetical protein